MISARHNHNNGYIALVNIELGDLPQKLSVGEHELVLKSEFHISLVCTKKIAVLIDPTRVDEIRAEIVESFKQFIQTTPLTDYEITNEFRLVKRDERVTLVVLVAVPGIEDFFAKLEEKYDKKIPVQVTHITLYTLQPEVGIGILSLEELERDSEPVNVSLSLS
jgi:hypothetical protein